MTFIRRKSADERKRVLEVFGVSLTTLLIFALSRVETRLFSLSESLSENQEFFTTLVFFALININVILILVLSFLIFRNVTRLILERKRGILGSKLRIKLVMALVFFAIAPTILLFYVSTKYITTSFEAWFSERVKIAMQDTRSAGNLIYKQDQKRLQSLARIALERIEIKDRGDLFSQELVLDIRKLKNFESEYGLNALKVYDLGGNVYWDSLEGQYSNSPSSIKDSEALSLAVRQFLSQPELYDIGLVVGEEKQDVVKGFAPVRDPKTNRLLGVLLTEVRFETQILKSIEKIISEFGDLKPGAQLIRFSYLILMIVITLLIVFTATWLGFYVAREITGPLQSLAGATREIALGNYNVNLSSSRDDETGQLVQAFNLMTRDLKEHQKNTEAFQEQLKKSNRELEQRRQYMEIVLKHISAGVISLDNGEIVTSVNEAAEKLLKINGSQLTGNPLKEGLSQQLLETFWYPIRDGLYGKSSYQGQLDLYGDDTRLLVNATQIFDRGQAIGFVIVFDDAKEQLRVQKVVAWREVARRIAHEIKNPITPIKLNAERLLRRYKHKFIEEDQEIFCSCLETITSQVDNLRDLVNEFSKFARLPAIRPKIANLVDVLEDVAKVYCVSYPEIKIDCSKLREVPDLYLDKEQMHRAFVNIFSNSIAAFVPDRPPVISLETDYDPHLQMVSVIIEDNGSGFPKEIQNKILEPYFSTKDEGTGLGLAIVNQIVSDHGGYLRICSRVPYGVTVVIELPASQLEQRT